MSRLVFSLTEQRRCRPAGDGAGLDFCQGSLDVTAIPTLCFRACSQVKVHCLLVANVQSSVSVVQFIDNSVKNEEDIGPKL